MGITNTIFNQINYNIFTIKLTTTIVLEIPSFKKYSALNTL